MVLILLDDSLDFNVNAAFKTYCMWFLYPLSLYVESLCMCVFYSIYVHVCWCVIVSVNVTEMSKTGISAWRPPYTGTHTKERSCTHIQ